MTEPTTRIAYLVRMLSNSLSQQVERALRPLALTQAQLAALAQLEIGPEEGLSGAELGRRAGVTAQSMSTSLAGLERRGLVLRAPHPTHGRVIQVQITEEGSRLLERAQQLTRPVDARALALLDDKEREQLRELLLRTMTAVGLPSPADPLEADGHSRIEVPRI